jgi:hypothetical protein
MNKLLKAFTSKKVTLESATATEKEILNAANQLAKSCKALMAEFAIEESHKFITDFDSVLSFHINFLSGIAVPVIATILHLGKKAECPISSEELISCICEVIKGNLKDPRFQLNTH